MYVSDMGARCQDAHIQGGLFFFFYIYNINDLHKNNDLGDFLENLVVPRGKGS